MVSGGFGQEGTSVKRNTFSWRRRWRRVLYKQTYCNKNGKGIYVCALCMWNGQNRSQYSYPETELKQNCSCLNSYLVLMKLDGVLAIGEIEGLQHLEDTLVWLQGYHIGCWEIATPSMGLALLSHKHRVSLTGVKWWQGEIATPSMGLALLSHKHRVSLTWLSQ